MNCAFFLTRIFNSFVDLIQSFQMIRQGWILGILLLRIPWIWMMENDLIRMEENLLYEQLRTSANLSSFYQILLKSNGIDDFTRIERVITAEDIQQFQLENKVNCSLNQLNEFISIF